MASSISSEIINMQNITAQMEAKQEKTTGSEQELGQDAFLKLMLEQMKYQDPLEPTGNTEFLQQQATFTQVNELQKLNESIATTSETLSLLTSTVALSNDAMQASILVDKEVTIQDPNDSSKEITGIVTSASFSSSGSSITVNGEEYSLNLVKNVRNPSESSNNSTISTEDNNTI